VAGDPSPQGVHRDTIAQKLIGEVAPKYDRAVTLRSPLQDFDD
jgi:hypothetical protein